jgi:hypothetical protein
MKLDINLKYHNENLSLIEIELTLTITDYYPFK